MNLLAGVLGVIFAFRGRFDIAFILMLCASVFDFCDGLAARLLNAYSDMGKELDSLCDMVSFGVLPSVMLVCLMRQCTFSDSLLCYVPVTVALASALRLARFNIDETQHDSFAGLATPASALICGSLCYFIVAVPGTFLSAWASDFIFIPVLSLTLSALMLCRIPMFSFKIKKGEGAESTLYRKRLAFLVNLVLVAVIVVVSSLNWSMAVLLSLLVYVIMNLVFWIFKV